MLDLESLPPAVGSGVELQGKTEVLERTRPPASPPVPPPVPPLVPPRALTPSTSTEVRSDTRARPTAGPPLSARPDTRIPTPPASPASPPSKSPGAAHPLESVRPAPGQAARSPSAPVPILDDASLPTEPHVLSLPRTSTPVERAVDDGPSPFGDLPPDLEAPTPAARSARPPPLPSRSRPPNGTRPPLLVDPPEPPAKPRAPAQGGTMAPAEQARDTTDPDQRHARTDLARRERGLVALLSRGLVNDAALTAALDEHVARGGRVLEILVAQGVVTDEAVADALAAESGRSRLPDAALRAKTPPVALVRRLPQTYLLARRVLPLSLDQGVLALAVADPFDAATVDELKSLVGATSAEAFVAARGAITAATVEAYRAMGIGGVPGVGGDGPRALVCTADDAKATRIGARLAQEGIRVEHVLTGEAAREILQTRPPDVVLCAHDLPGLAVTNLLLHVRGNPRSAELPFFVFGPRSDEDLATRILDLGADDFFGEPLRLEMMLAKIRRAVGKNRPLSTEGWALNDPSGVARILAGAAPSLDEGEPVAAAPATAAPPPKPAPAPSFLDQIAMPGLDDLPELPPGFSDDATPDAPPAMPTGVMGTLRQMALPEIVQSLEMGRKTARVDLVPAEGEKGMIAFETGQIRYAECGALRGDDAFFQLARHKEGFFRIHYGDKPPDVNIEHPTTFLLLEAMRRMDEEGVAPKG